MLHLANIHASYELIEVLKGVSLEISKGEIVTIIGANGAGQTTTLMSISGIIKATKGSISFNNQDISNLPPHKVVELGISHVPEGRRIFPRFTVFENLEMGGFLCRDKKELKERIDMVYSHFPILLERRNQYGGTLSGGEQQMLAIGRALMAKPILLLLDEPSMGLSPLLVQEIGEIIRNINRQGVSVLLVEQNSAMALGLANRGYLLQVGNIVAQGDAKALMRDELVKKAYLG